MGFVLKFISGLIAVLLLVALGAYIRAGWGERPLDDNARKNAPGQFLTTSAGQLHYRWHGEEGAPVIVMAHGFSTPNFIFEQNAEALVDAGFRVLTFDHFGRGWSDRPKAQYTPDFYDRELTDLLDGLGVTEPVGLVGLSMGGVIVSEFTARHPERVSKLFLFVSAGLTLGDGVSETSDKILRTPILGDWVWRVFGKGILLSDPQYDESQLSATNKLAGDLLEQTRYRGYFPALLSSYRHLPMSDQDQIFTRLAVTNIPVMAIYGEKDQTVLVESAARLQALIPSASVEIIPDGEHGLNYQMHDITNPLIVNYFSQNP